MKLRAEIRPGYTVGQRWLEIAGITAFFSLMAVVCARLHTVVTVQEPSHWVWVIAGGFFTGLLFSDFVSGFVHWLADNWGNPEWPILGTGFIRPFREHHTDPKEMTRHDFVELNGNNCLISIPTFFLALYQPFDTAPESAVFYAVFWMSTALWVFGTNQFHAWAHVDQPPRIVALLQTCRLILSRPNHDEHHKAPHNRNYCITTGWLNAPLRWLRFFEILEWSITQVTGVKPVHFHTRMAHERR